MEAKDTLSKIIEALMDLEVPVQQKYLMDFICAKDNEDIEEEEGKTDLETYGILQGEEDAMLEIVIKEGVKSGYIDQDEKKNLTFTANGKKFQKKPKSFVIDYDDEEEAEDATIDSSIDDLMHEIEADESPKKTGLNKKSSMKIELIQAIDLKKALDDFAETQGLDFNVILDELESIIHSGTHIDIDYFLDEVFTQDNIDELCDFYDRNKGNVDKAIKEYEDAYSPEELRLLRIKWLMKNRNK